MHSESLVIEVILILCVPPSLTESDDDEDSDSDGEAEEDEFDDLEETLELMPGVN